MKKVLLCLGMVVIIAFSSVKTYASSCSFTHSVSCDCCGDTAMVTHTLNVKSVTNASTTQRVASGSVNEIQTWLHVNGRCGDIYGKDITVGCCYYETLTYEWGNHYDLGIIYARCDYGIRKGNSWDWMSGHWMGV